MKKSSDIGNCNTFFFENLKRNIILSLLLTPILLFAAVSTAAFSQLKGVDDPGRALKSAHPPERIISLAPSFTSQLDLLNAGDRLAGNTTYCKDPLGKKIEKVGTVLEINLEKIISLNPDLVLATPLTNAKSIQKLNDLGVKVVIFPPPKKFSEVCDQFLELGKIVGKKREAEEIIVKAKERVKAINKRTKNLSKPKVFVQLGAKPLFAAIGDSFVDDLINFAGGVNIGHNLERGFITREEVVKKNPDIIMIVTMGITGDREKKVWEKFNIISAVTNNRLYVIDSNKLCSPTPETFVDLLEEVAAILHLEKRGK